jgi:serine O-acetyltransferase
MFVRCFNLVVDPTKPCRLYDRSMARERRTTLLAFARVWAYPLWRSVIRSKAADDVVEDIDFWMDCIGEPELLALDRYSRFAYLSGALTEFRTLVHFRLRSSPGPLRFVLRKLYRPAAALTLEADRIGPALFIQHGVGTIVTAESIGSHCWINQQVTIGYNAKGRPTLHDRVRVGAGAVVIGPITLHDGATVGANATVIHDVAAGVTVVAPTATILSPRLEDGGAQA